MQCNVSRGAGGGIQKERADSIFTTYQLKTFLQNLILNRVLLSLVVEEEKKKMFVLVSVLSPPISLVCYLVVFTCSVLALD